MAILFFIVFIDLVGFGIVIPLLPYYALHFAASPWAVTLMMACYSLAQIFSSPLLGRLSDKVGRRPVLLVSLAVSAASYLGLGFADALWMLFAARLVAGAGAGNIAAAQAYITDVTKPENRAKGMGMIGAAFGLGFTVGPAIGGLIAGSHPDAARLALPAFAAAGLSSVAFLLALTLLKESLPAHLRNLPPRAGRLEFARIAFSRPILGRLILVLFTATAAFAGMETTFALWAFDSFGWGPREVGWIFFYVGMVLVLLQGGLIGRLAKLYGETRLLTAGAAVIGSGLLALALAHSLALVLAATALLSIGVGLLNPSVTSLVSRQAGEDERGGIMGVSQSASSLARIVGPAVAGAAFTFGGRNAPYYLGALVMAAVVALALKLPRKAAVSPAVETS